MIFSLSDRPVAKVTIPPPEARFNVEVELPNEAVPNGVEETLKKLGWYPEYASGLDTTVFKRLDNSPYANGYYHWYEVVALESLNLLTLGMQRDAANERARGSDGVAAAMNTL